jgi:5-methylcytosine-specific restriction endonuclease McrA
MGLSLRKEHHRHSKRVTRGERWRTLRVAILERDGFKCRSCGTGGRLEVDHIRPVRTHPELSYEPGNLQSLCPSCHTKKTRIECGHPPPSPERQDWTKAVSQLERPGKKGIIHKGETDA